jgi:hypothetical protein
MATKYTAFIWPPMIFALPVQLGKIGGTFVIGKAPPMILPVALNPSQNGGTAKQLVFPNMVKPASTVSVQNWTALAPPATANLTSGNNQLVQIPAGGATASQTAYVSVDKTRKAINTLFRIVSNTPGSGL